MGERRDAVAASDVHLLSSFLVKCHKLLRAHRWSEAAAFRLREACDGKCCFCTPSAMYF